ncbi:MAG: hypothetical protein JSS67_04470 [Bacteroidetes bacterium]|nr:hypothetical protein [Bacteroidota bacterium]
MNKLKKWIIYIIAGICLLIVTGYFTWQRFKYKIVEKTLSAKVEEQTNGLYTIQYDSLSFDEVTGYASIKNIRIIPDTALAKTMSVDKMPDLLIDASIQSITVTGVKTAKALEGNALQGDSIIIDHPDLTIYSLKPLRKNSMIQMEANTIYKQILGKLDYIKVGFVFINGANATAYDFFNKNKNFDFIGGKLLLDDVLIDSTHNLDTTRILFCKQAAFTVDSFISYNHDRKQLSVKNVHFLGKQKQLLFDQISLNRFENDTSAPIRMLDADKLILNGVQSNQIVMNKNLAVDSIQCNNIIFYQLPLENLKTSGKKVSTDADSMGFVNVYGVSVQYLNFPKVSFVPFAQNNFATGTISIKVWDVIASRIYDLQQYPMDFTREAEVDLDRFSIKSKNGLYTFNAKNARINSLSRQLDIQSLSIDAFEGEKQFANHFHYQTDRYDVNFKGISLRNININDLLDKTISATDLNINNTVVKIYHDLHKPLRQKSKVGNYPSQLLQKINIPINIPSVLLKNALIEYRENEVVSDSIGVVSFQNSTLHVTNVTNIPSYIQKNNLLNIAFQSKILNAIPVKGNFGFSLNSKHGNFVVNGQVSAFDAIELNKVSIPMALIQINSGKINSLEFNFKGNDTIAHGKFVMKYDNLKVAVLKKDKESKDLKKRGLATFATNLIIANSNPAQSGLRTQEPEYKREIYKSFFNLVWKTIFTGMKETLGIP